MPAKKKTKRKTNTRSKKTVKKRRVTKAKARSKPTAKQPVVKEEIQLDAMKLDYETSRVVAAISYIIGILAVIPYLLVDKENKFLRFHTLQAAILGVVWIIAWVVVSIVAVILGAIPLIGWLLGALLWLAFDLVVIVITIYLAYQAYIGKKYEVPWIADFAKKNI